MEATLMSTDRQMNKEDVVSERVCVCVCVCVCILCLVTQSCPALCYPMDCSLPGSSVHSDFPGKNTWVGCLPCPPPGDLPNHPGLPHCRQILYQVSYSGSLHIHIYTYTYTHTHTHSGILFSYKKVKNLICSNMDGLGDYYTKWNKTG